MFSSSSSSSYIWFSKMGLMAAPAAFRKRGHLELQSQSNPNNWKRMFFLLKGVKCHLLFASSIRLSLNLLCVLEQNFLYYRYDKHEALNMLADPDVRRPGIVPLKLATLSSEQNEERKQFYFVITTPYITYRCKAKHAVDCSEWLAALSKKAAGKQICSCFFFFIYFFWQENDVGPALMPQPAAVDAADAAVSYKRPALQFELEGKQRVGTSIGCSFFVCFFI